MSVVEVSLMDHKQVLKIFKDAGALLEGHFILSSGLHSGMYLQCARVMMDARRGARLCRSLAQKVREQIKRPIEYVISPAMGGIIVGHEMGRQLGVPALFLERVEGVFTLRRGFDIPPKAHCLMVEDIVTSGLSSREAIESVRAHGGRVVGEACLVDRSGGKARVGTKLISLMKLTIPTYEPDNLPDELRNIPAEKPGSRNLQSRKGGTSPRRKRA
ncbi:MAG: orotate phosphoribosyltransferase [Parvularculales bacterium]